MEFADFKKWFPTAPETEAKRLWQSLNAGKISDEDQCVASPPAPLERCGALAPSRSPCDSHRRGFLQLRQGTRAGSR
jgi:hypothetical protein